MRLMDHLNPRGEAVWQAGGYATFGRRGTESEGAGATDDWLGYSIAVWIVLLFMILVGVLPVGQWVGAFV